MSKLTRAAETATLVARKERDFYGYAYRALDIRATLRRVALFYKGTGRYTLTAAERFEAVEILEARADERGWGAA